MGVLCSRMSVLRESEELEGKILVGVDGKVQVANHRAKSHNQEGLEERGFYWAFTCKSYTQI